MLIGIHGKKKAGKDAVAGMIVNLMPYADVHLMAFADRLKDLCHLAFGTPYKDLGDQSLKETAKGFQGMTPREQMISLSDVIKNAYGHDYFVNVVAAQVAAARQHLASSVPIVISDVRYECEADMIRSKGGTIWHVKRPEADMAEVSHSSEAGILFAPEDRVIHNTGTLDDLRQTVREALLSQLSQKA